MRKYKLERPWPHRWGRWEYLLRRDGSISLKGFGGSRDELHVPRSICGLPVTAISRCALSGQDSCIITLPDTVESIGAWALAYSEELQAVVIPASVRCIHETAFEDCPNVCLYVAPGSYARRWAQVRGLAFDDGGDMPRIAEAEQSYLSGDWAYEGMEEGGIILREYNGMEEAVEVPVELDGYPVRAIGGSCLRGNDFLQELIVPEGVESLGHFALSDCPSLRRVWLSDSLEFIGGCCFAYCRDLEEIRLPARLTCIQLMTFVGCVSLEEIRLPGGLREIEPMAFCGCKALRTVHPGEGSCALSKSAFDGCPSLQLPEELIGGEAAKQGGDEGDPAV